MPLKNYFTLSLNLSDSNLNFTLSLNLSDSNLNFTLSLNLSPTLTLHTHTHTSHPHPFAERGGFEPPVPLTGTAV